MRLRCLLYSSCILLPLVMTAGGRGEQPPTVVDANRGSNFVRIKRDGRDTAVAMETAIVSYVPRRDRNSGVIVDLISAVHVADAGYYEQLNRRFETYDAVLYELVAPAGTRIPKGGRKNGHPVAAVQGGMKSVLDLAYQLESIDYTKLNLIHADLSPQEFSQTMKDRGESFSQIFFRAMGQAMAQQNSKNGGSGDMRMLFALFSADRPLAMKRMMAEQFEDLEGSMNVFDGPDGSTLISERNKRALDVLQKQLAAGKKRIGIFYGAGHMPDIERRLAKAPFSLEPKSVRWLLAWDLSGKKSGQ